MRSWRVLWSIARYEMVLLVRSWAFRVFTVLALLVTTLITVAVSLPRDVTFFLNRALSGAFPLLAIKLFNVFLALISVFLATEFIKRDRKLDTSQVYFTHSYSNGTYILGKFLGIFSLLFLLDLLVLVITGIIQAFFSRTPFLWPPYLLYLAFITMPTAVFMVGLSVFLGSLVRSQAAVYLLALVYAFFVLVVAGPTSFFVFDSFAYFTPVMVSDVIGLGNLGDLLLLRGAYFALGLALILGATLLMKRLRQSSWINGGALVAAVLIAAAAAAGFAVYAGGKTEARSFRAGLEAESEPVAGRPTATVVACDIRMKIAGGTLEAESDLTLANLNDTPLGPILLTLNPGLKVAAVRGPSGPMDFEQKRHLITVKPAQSLAPGEEIRIALAYAGKVDERYCYLDIPDDRYWSALRFWLVSVPKRYAVVSDKFVHLTPESGWYPRAGLPPGLMFPRTIKQDFSRYSLSVTLPDVQVAISQGAASDSPGKAGERTFTFRPDDPLPQISLTAGPYEQKSVDVDGTTYALFTWPGHDRATPLLSELKADLPTIIRQVRSAYEAQLGMTYPYKRFALVELPIQITSYNRLWNTAQEQVQPEIVFLPEMGALCTGADFRSAQRIMLGPGMGAGSAGQGAQGARGGTPAGQRAASAAGGQRSGRGQGASLSPKDIQRGLLNRFLNSNLTELTPMGGARFRAGFFGIQFETNSETRFGVFPLFATYSTHFSAPDWPLLDYVIEAYLRGRVTAQAGPALRLAQATTMQEDISRILAERSLDSILADRGRRNWPFSAILEAKSKQLLAVIQAKLGKTDFDAKLSEWLKGLRSRPVREAEAREFFRGLGEIDLDGLFAGWAKDKGVPGFIFDKLESFRVVENERQRAQLKFEVTNPTDTAGVLKVEFVVRGAMGGGRGGMMGGGGIVVSRGVGGGIAMVSAAAAAAERRFYIVPARTVKTIGIVMDQPAVATSIDTFISRNLPASFTLPFLTTPAQPGAVAFDGEADAPITDAEDGAGGTYIVDDEDPGFRTPEGDRENWLRRFIRKTFPASVDSESEFAQFRDILNPPGQWTPVVMQNFYGRFVRSAFLKKGGNGQSRVTWSADLREAGDYDIAFFNTVLMGGGGMAAIGGRGGFAGGPGTGAGSFGGRGGQGGAAGQRGAIDQRGQSGGQRGGPAGQRAGGPAAFAARIQPGKKHFIVHHEYGNEEVVIDLRDAPAGWVTIGTFRFTPGPNTIELTDRSETGYVLADAVRWSKHKE